MNLPPRQVVAAAMPAVRVQDPHPSPTTAAGMAAILAACEPLDLHEVQHVRTSEYVVARGVRSSGEAVAIRAGDPLIRDAHLQELQMAQVWAGRGGRASSPLAFHESSAGDVSVWLWVPSQGELSFRSGGETLRGLHEIGRSLGAEEREVFVKRGWRAPEKIARRLCEMTEQPHVTLETLLLAAACCNVLSEEVRAAYGEGEWTTIHGDYQPGNWVGGAEVVAVDFATSCWGPRLWDLTLLAGRCGPGRSHSREDWEETCGGYRTSPDVLERDEHRPLVALRNLSSLVVRARKPRRAHPHAPAELHEWCLRELEGRG